ncbi:MAG: hypothetical protein M0026_01905 [Nocardiopsaceae bacterium]|nr:hypothetical protein [Nocardiopsaceae bacterium]
MYAFLALIVWGLAEWCDRKLTGAWTWWIPLAIAIFGSMLLYASQLSVRASEWMLVPVTWVTELWAMVAGEPLPTTWVMSAIAGACLLVTVWDVVKDHAYNGKARFALIIAPIAAHQADGWVGGLVDAVHSAGAEIAVMLTGGMLG